MLNTRRSRINYYRRLTEWLPPEVVQEIVAGVAAGLDWTHDETGETWRFLSASGENVAFPLVEGSFRNSGVVYWDRVTYESYGELRDVHSDACEGWSVCDSYTKDERQTNLVYKGFREECGFTFSMPLQDAKQLSRVAGHWAVTRYVDWDSSVMSSIVRRIYLDAEYTPESPVQPTELLDGL